MNNKRPVSPHLQIYKPQLTSVLSITHRFTGVILSLFSILIPFSLLFISFGSDYYQLFLLIANHVFIKIILIGTIFSLAFHLSNGIRHLFWDMGLGLSIEDSYMSGYLVILTSILITFFAIFYIT
ncbi:MAG: succinate dehydrogenase, cytochrome b556 subunit [Gammaproteobacteria bacterium]|nr:succinate dehydrogenase, cytochrome b556 subunit [Gammaproteobacteria bacterium]MBT4462100.1 succinate dehydrogenase, cytochrome b556 subunit [Gammaproteobacteria bacterium]MBT4654959.1 succinate dehydrogenase, cytochrome b556 subunit [Gammaproteobacteria bacterium]MBT5116551.1 succinate dehydrogenase, cytochrome b556 subunit [Gammaproteobacteria bacterium]MBT5761556.1 succinate dehydrogenase, cytochrome b556 subunit [Gammaproteobacteria bacterium]